jgi:hypothetical protein
MSLLLDAALYGTPIPSIFIGAAERAQLLPELKAADVVAINMAAEEAVLADVDTYTDWLGGHCMRVDREHTRIGYVPNDDAHLLNFAESLDIPQLVAALHSPHHRLVCHAAQLLRDKYLADPCTQRYLTRMAEDIGARW